jgi:hypothetical protein
MMKHMKVVLLVLLYAGWVIPIAVATDFALGSAQIDPRANSFPFIHAARALFSFGFLWLASALTVWTVRSQTTRR